MDGDAIIPSWLVSLVGQLAIERAALEHRANTLQELLVAQSPSAEPKPD
jgi:hypothetical protein